jgi:hypothetical protein
MKTINEIRTFLVELDKKLNISLTHHFSDDRLKEIQALRDPDQIFNYMTLVLDRHEALKVEFDSYQEAIDYLAKNDPSLTESLLLCNDYSRNCLDSKIFAIYHASNQLRNKFLSLESKIKEFFTEKEGPSLPTYIAEALERKVVKEDYLEERLIKSILKLSREEQQELLEQAERFSKLK